ncbi:MAG TPA: hypothetical protein VEV41_12050, partial [Terriglobales bacterium]|nr:hypothetical protein [Terriglobales bacterium]
THGADNYTATRRALAALYGLVQRHAAMLSFVEAFWVMGVLFLTMLPFVLLLKNPRAKPSLKRRTRGSRLVPAIPLEVLVHKEEDELLVHY